jgi:polysaccharide export outer membrane protein
MSNPDQPRFRPWRLAPVLAAAGFLAACTPGGNLQVLPDYMPGAYKLGGGDQLRIITFGNDQLTGQFRVDDQGKIAMPLIGNVDAAGLTPSDLAAKLSETLKDQKFLKDPSVSVEVLAYRPIYVLGEVAKPGQYPYTPGMTTLTAVAVAGGYTYRAFEDFASDIRTSNGAAEEGKITSRSFLAPGDVIKIYERHF